ncbi:MAG: hypothetical protein D5S00_02660 [Tindallia sp. MSAO_Bac2]|nr:MAG: hypothetical protein D5S00_02660 [Tindallia sp. MSAO_Bac2]
MKGLPSEMFRSYRQLATKKPELLWDGYLNTLREIENSPAKYKGKPVEFLYQPFFLTEAQWKDLETITGKMLELTKKVIDHYLEFPEFRRYFGFDPLMEKLILKEPGYSYWIPMTRIDVFYHFDGFFQFCEINTDGSSGMTECRELQQIIRSSPALTALPLNDEAIEEGEFFDSWVQAFLSNYREYSNGNETPNIAIVDWFQAEVPSEFMEFQKAFQKADCRTKIVDVRDLTYREGRLQAGDFCVDAVYRRLVSWEVVERYPETRALVDAYLAGDVCVIGPLRSQIPHNKRFFAVLHQESATDFLSTEDRRFIKEHIPYTAILNRNNPDRWKEWAENKDQYIIKPEDLYASSGVCAGRDYHPDEWEKLLAEAAEKDYLIQKYCQVLRMPMLMFQNGRPIFEEQQYLMGCFLYNENFQGPYIRTGRKSIIGSVVECYTVPAYKIRETE